MGRKEECFTVDRNRKMMMLNRQIAYAKRYSRFYDYLPEEPLLSEGDLERIPMISEKDLIESGREMLCCSSSGIKRTVSLFSSGTTAPPKRVFFSEKDLSATREFFRDGMHTLCEPGEKTAIFLPGIRQDGMCDLLSRGLLAYGAIPKQYGLIKDYGRASEFCNKEKPEVYVGFPVQMRALAILHPELRPGRVLISADYCALSLIKSIETSFRIAKS